MGASAQDSRLVIDEAGSSQEHPDSQAARGAAIKAERDAAFMTQEDVAIPTGLSRQTIARAEHGHASESTYRTLENFFKNEISGPVAPAADNGGLVEFEIEGDFGVRVVVRGPVENVEALERSVARIVASIREGKGEDPDAK
jgi:DNA-binding XRE family transcriptional regulator